MSIKDKNTIKLDKEIQEYVPLKDTDNKDTGLKENNIENTMIKKITTIKKIKDYLISHIRTFSFKKFIITILASIIAYYLFYISLEGCYEGELICSEKVSWIQKKIIEGALSTIIIYVLTILSILKIISKFHFIHMYIIFKKFRKKYKGIKFEHHGYFNFFYSAAFYVILLTVTFPFLVIYFLYKKKKSITTFIIAFSLLYYLLIFIGFQKNVGCGGWEKGLNNSFIENDKQKYGCQIKFPKFCPQKIISKYSDRTISKNITCLKRIDEDKFSLKNQNKTRKITNETKRIGFSFYEVGYSVYNEELLNNFEKYLVDMDNKTQLEKIGNYNKPELVVDYSSNPLGELKINLNYREELSQERKLLEKNSNPYYNNILVIYIDSLSRVQSIRSLKKTMSFIEKFMNYDGGKNPKFPSEIYHSFQFFKYYSHDSSTLGNYPQMYLGREGRDKSGKKTRIMKFLKNNGYVTGLASDISHLEPTGAAGKRTKEDFFDHLSYLCSRKYMSISTDTIRCLYGNLKIKYVLDYGKQFWKAYKNNRKFLFLACHDGHERTLDVIKYSDEPLYEFLNNLFDENLLKDTAITIISDHGMKIGPYSLFYDFFLKEYRLPMFYMILNDRKNLTYEEQYKFLNINQQSFITGYDYYNTLSHFIYGDAYQKIPNKTDEVEYPKSSRGESLLMKIDQKKRNPKNYYNMSSRYCT